MTHTSPGFFPSGLPEYWPCLGPLKCFLPGYFCGTRTESKLNTYLSLVSHMIVSYRPENLREQCSPCSKCQTIRFLILSSSRLNVGHSAMSRGRISFLPM